MTSKIRPRQNDLGPAWLAWFRGRGFAFQTLVLGSAVLVVFLLIFPVASWCEGKIGLIASAAAGGVCLVGGMVALTISRVFAGSDRAWIGVLVGMLPRMAVPLIAAIFVEIWEGPLAESGFLYYLIVFYLMTLGVETIITLPTEQSSDKCIQPSSNDVAS